jgi:ATP-binding cassette subfamily G (WHITE) protein 1
LYYLNFPQLFLNEHRNGWYTTLSYYISKTITEVPLQLIFPLCYTYFLYWYSQQIGIDGFFDKVTWRFGYFLGITLLSCFIAQGLGFLIGILCVKSFSITVIVSSSVLLFLFLFSGFFVKTAQMGAGVEWITYFSFIRFSFESLLLIIYGFDRCPDFPVISKHGILENQESTILFIFNLKDSDLLGNFYWLMAHFLLIRIAAFIILKSMADPDFLKPTGFIRRVVNSLVTRTTACFQKSRGILYKAAMVCVVLFVLQLIAGLIVSAILSSQSHPSAPK